MDNSDADLQKQPPYSKRVAQIYQIALKILKENGGQLPLHELLARIPQLTELTPRDLEVYKTGGVRWSVHFQFYAINYEKAGFIARDQGVWSLTPEGEKALQLPPDEMLSQANKAYQKWRTSVGEGQSTEEVAEGDKSDGVSGTEAGVVVSVGADFFASQARSGIAQAVQALNPYEFQDFVAAVVRGLGYHIGRLSPRGPDGGTDILAFPDPLGTQRPHVRVQVKHWKGQKAGREEIAALRGILIPDREIGLFVASGGFTAEALREATRGSPHIRCMDLDEAIDAYIENYDRLEERYRARIRLRHVFVYAPEEA